MFERFRTITNPRQRDKETCNKLAKVSTSCWVARWIPTEEIADQGVQGLAIAMCICVPTADDRPRNILEHVTSLNRMEWWNDGIMGWLIISLMPCKQISVLRGPWHTTLQLPGPKLPWFDEAQPCYKKRLSKQFFPMIFRDFLVEKTDLKMFEAQTWTFGAARLTWSCGHAQFFVVPDLWAHTII